MTFDWHLSLKRHFFEESLWVLPNTATDGSWKEVGITAPVRYCQTFCVLVDHLLWSLVLSSGIVRVSPSSAWHGEDRRLIRGLLEGWWHLIGGEIFNTKVSPGACR